MAKQISKDPITQQDLTKFIEENDDFGFEIGVFKRIRELGIVASHGGSYIDRLTHKSRQFDIRCHIDLVSRVKISMAVECKNLHESFPLLISRVPRVREEMQLEWIQSRGFHGNINHLGASLAKPAQYYLDSYWVGKATTQVGKALGNGEFVSNDHEVFDKWAQALASANDLIRPANAAEMDRQPGYLLAVLPVLVVPDKTLWAADYSNDGVLAQDSPSEITEAELFVGEKYKLTDAAFYTVSNLHVFTTTGFFGFLDKMLNDNSFKARLHS